MFDSYVMYVSQICMNCHTLFHSCSFIVVTTSTRLWLLLRVKRWVSQMEQELSYIVFLLFSMFVDVDYCLPIYIAFRSFYRTLISSVFLVCWLYYFSDLALLADISLEIQSPTSSALYKHCFITSVRIL